LTETTADSREDYREATRLVGLGWLGSGIALGILNYPLNFLLKDELRLDATHLSLFLTLGNIPTYLKPLLGILSDAVPLFGTRRRHYLIVGCLLSMVFFVALALVPRAFGVLLATHFSLTVQLVLVSAVMGGLMVDVGKRHRATGRLTAQRVGINRFVDLFAGVAGANLAKLPLLYPMTLCAAMYAALTAMYVTRFREPKQATVAAEVPQEAARQFRVMMQSRTLWSAAGLVALVIAAPGFGTAMLFYQTDTLHFSKAFLGWLALVNGLFGIAGALLYGRLCRRFALRRLLRSSILIHGLGTLFYLGYRTPGSALAITALEGVAQTLAILPLYDLAARATPKRSAALAYSVMMSVWNLTASLSNLFGSWLYDHFRLTIMELVWLNAGTTLLVLFAVPLLPAVLMDAKEGEAEGQG
jgi:predicted MFS family arabinose efflux permease